MKWERDNDLYEIDRRGGRSWPCDNRNSYRVPAAKLTRCLIPNKVVTLVTHSSPGGGSDVFLREMSKYLGKYIGATFIVENVQGGSGAKAMARVATAPADGSVFYATTPTYIYTSLDEQAAEHLQGHGSAGEHLRR